MNKTRKDNIKVYISIAVIFLLSALSVFTSFEKKNKIPTGGAIYNVGMIEDQVKTGNLSMHEAEFQKIIE